MQRPALFSPGLGKTGGEHRREGHAGAAALLERIRDRGRRQDDADVIGHLRNGGQRRETRQSENLLPLRIDRIDVAGEAEIDQLAHAASAELAQILGGADVRDAARREEAAQVGKCVGFQLRASRGPIWTASQLDAKQRGS